MSLGSVTTKMLNINVSPKITKRIAGLKVPKNCATYNFVSGFSPKKGNFEIYTFFDKCGNITKRVMTYLNSGNETRVVRAYNKRGKAKVIRETVFNNGKESGFSLRRLFKLGDKNSDGFRMTVEKLGEKNDEHTISILKPGEKSRELGYIFDWKEPIDIYTLKDCNVTSNVDFDFLPMLVSYSNPKRTNQLISWIQKYLEKDLKLSGYANPVVRATSRALNPLASRSALAGVTNSERGLACAHYENYTGNVKILNSFKNAIDLLQTMAHEFFHMSDARNIVKLTKRNNPSEFIFNLAKFKPGRPDYNFIKKAQQYGAITPYDKEYALTEELLEAAENYGAMFSKSEGLTSRKKWAKNKLEERANAYEVEVKRRFIDNIKKLTEDMLS